MCTTWPVNLELRECTGVALIDEIDLHLHPKWQMEVLPKLSQRVSSNPIYRNFPQSFSGWLLGMDNILVMRPTQSSLQYPP